MRPTFLRKSTQVTNNSRNNSKGFLKRFNSIKRVSLFLAIALVSCTALVTLAVLAAPAMVPGGPTVTITPAVTPTASDNDYTRLNNAIQTAVAGETIILDGTFNWTEANAAASWALGSDGVVSAADDYSILVPANVNNVILTADNLGDATIQGPGDLAAVNLEAVLVFDGGDNQGWTISNITFLDFDLAIGMFNGPGGTDAFNNTHITNNHIRIARDLNATVAPADVNQNIGIHFSFGTNQLISGNLIEIQGDGVSDSATSNFSSEVGIQSNTSGGNVYNGLQITNNTLLVLHAQSADPENVLGIWENAHAHTSNITLSLNNFSNLGAANNPATNLQRGFRVTSHSSATTTVTYVNNSVRGANIGFQWLAGANFSGNQPVVLKSNTLTANATGVLVQSQGVANLSFNRITGNTAGLNNVDGTVTAENNWWGCNAGPGGAGCDPVTGVTSDFNPWLVLGISASPSTIPENGTSTVTADMTHNSDGAVPSVTDFLPNLTSVTFGATEGTMSPPSSIISFGQATSTFTSTSPNSGTASATVDNQTVNTPITVLPLVVTITPAVTPTAADNDYTRINNAVQATFNGQTIKLLGTFNWTEANAAASWALGSNGVASDGDDYSILVPANINNVTFTADNLGDATIQGPGDLPAVNLEAVLVFDGGDNQNWTISNIRFVDFDLSLGMFNGVGGADAFNNTHITNNYIRIASDLNATVAPTDVNQNIGIHFSFGTNEVISGNTIEIQGNGVSDGTNFSTDVGMQSNTSGGAVYDGLQITDNTIRVLNAQSANPQVVLGIWENSHGHTSNITVSGNTFTNPAAGNNPATNLQRAFRVTSHSSATTSVLYQNNTVTGANIGFQWIAASNFSGNQPVIVQRNTITGGGTGVLVQSQGLANLSFNRITGNSVAGLGNVDGVVTAENNWWGCNAGPGSAGCDSVTGTADSNPWLVLNVGASPTTINSGGSSTVTADMRFNSDGVNTAISGTLPLTPVTFTATQGTMSPPSGTITAGLAVSTFTSTSGSSGTACATVDNQLTCTPITVNAPSFTIDDVTHNEGNSGTTSYTFTITKVGTTSLSTSVDYATLDGSATSPTDFTAIPATTVTFLPADTTKQITVLVNGDTTVEPDEAFSVSLSNPVNATIADGLGSGLITNDDADVTLSVSPLSVAEDGAPNLVYTFTRSGATAGALTVNFSVAGTATFATDYTQTGAATFSATSGTVTFSPSSSVATVVVDPSTDATAEPDETVFLTVTTGTGYNAASPSSATGTITNDDNADVSVAVAPAAVSEDGATNLVYTFTRNGVPSNALTVNFSVGGTANFGTDYSQTGAATFSATTGTVTFGAGNATATVTVDPTADLGFEPNETVILTVTAGTGYNVGTPSSATGTINDDDSSGGVIQFSSAFFSTTENSFQTTITVQRLGDTTNAVTVNYATPDDSDSATVVPCATVNGFASPRCDFTTALGTLRFAAGETSKTFIVLISQDNYVEGPETLTLTLSNPTGGAVLGVPSAATLTIADDVSEPAQNPIDDPANFVRQQYHDFLNREPDSSGFAFWTNQITSCGTDPVCIDVKRVNVSAAFYLSIEFQGTGYFVERIFKTAYGDATGNSTNGGTPHTLPVPIVRFSEFLPDTQEIGNGVVVGQPGFEAVLEANKQAYVARFVQTPRFTTAYPGSMTPAQFVDTLNANAGNPLSTTERNQLVADLTAATKTRADVVRAVAEDGDLINAEFNRAFVLMQYFGYLRRNPNAAPEVGLDYTGFDFWLTKLNQFNGNFQNADMVKSFLVSGEYRHRFGTP